LLLASAQVFADIETSSGWWIFRRLQSAKPRSITATNSPSAGDISGVLYNPAAIVGLEKSNIMLISEKGSGGDDYTGGVLYGYPTNGGALCAGAAYYNGGQMTLDWIENGEFNERTATAQEDTMAFLTYGFLIGKDLLVGATVKGARSTIAEVSTSYAYAGDLGLIYLFPDNGLSLSLSAQNMGYSTKFLDRGEKLPALISAGGYVKLTGDQGPTYFGLGIDCPYLVNEQRIIPNVGLECKYNIMNFNVGYDISNVNSSFQIGIGVAVSQQLDFSYAYIPALYLSDTHRFSMAFHF
jgi:hypothetical protein